MAFTPADDPAEDLARASPLSSWAVLALVIFAIALHLSFHDIYLGHASKSGQSISADTLLITALFAILLGRSTLGLVPPASPALARAAMLLMWGTTVVSFLFCMRAVLYPYEADTMEGNIILQGVNVWSNPALLYPDPERSSAVSYIFPPLAGVLWGTIYDLAGRVLFYPRILNFGLICLTGVLLTRLIRLTRLQGWLVFCSWICLQIFFCGYLCSLRTDALLAFLAAASCVLFRAWLDRGKSLSLIACGVVLAAAILSKQHGFLVLAGFLCVLLWRRQFREAGLLAAIAILPFAAVSVWLNRITGGWYERTLTLNAHRFSISYSITALSALGGYAVSAAILAAAIYAAWEVVTGKTTGRAPVWLWIVAGIYLPIACAGVLQGGVGSTDNFAFEFALLLPLLAFRFFRTEASSTGWPLLLCAALFACSLPYFVAFRPFANWLVYAPQQAEQVVSQIESTKGPVLLSRRQEFLMRTGRPVLDDLGDMNFEFVPAGYKQVATRINRDIRAGKYQLIMLEAGEVRWLDPQTQNWLAEHYDLSSDPERQLFQDRYTKRVQAAKNVAQR